MVVGRVVATRKDEKLVGSKLLITQPLHVGKGPAGRPIVAVDTVGAGIGEKVIFVTGSVAARVMADHLAPVDAAIVGIVDSVEGRDLQWDDGAGGWS